jgi:alpha-D-xyloside xylohydrolase
MKKLLVFFSAVVLFSMCSRSVWTLTDDGVIIRLGSSGSGVPSVMKLEVINEKIIRVVATPEKEFSRDQSLCVVEQTDPVPPFDVRQSIDTLILSTSALKAKVNLTTGQVIFTDTAGKIILKERKEGRSFAPVTVEGTDGYSFRQVFESPAGEGFYGLGQHQSDEFNYKGLNEVLYQYNTKVSVPFIISSKNYGILWDNYSLTRFGDPRDYSQINLFRLYGDDGAEGGLTASYYINSDTSKVFIRREEKTIDYENLTTIKDFPEKFPFYGSTITWTGSIEPQESGLFSFRLYYAGYTKLWIDDELVVPERWRTAWNPNTYKFRKDLEKGRRYKIRLEWKPDGGVSYIGLKALSPLSPEDRGALSLSSEMGDQIDYYFISGNNFDKVISGYRTLTGKAPIMPEWALGFWQSRERYK